MTEPVIGAVISGAISTETVVAQPSIAFSNVSTTGAIEYSTLESGSKIAEAEIIFPEIMSISLVRYATWFSGLTGGGVVNTPTTRQIIIR